MLKSQFSLTEARVLYELAQRGSLTASDLCRDLGLDAGYLSRILKTFEQRGLIMRVASARDGRQTCLSLTRRRPSGVRAAGPGVAGGGSGDDRPTGPPGDCGAGPGHADGRAVACRAQTAGRAGQSAIA
ncbi:MAG: MarR family transcriptional regulator [Rhodopila sp.]